MLDSLWSSVDEMFVADTEFRSKKNLIRLINSVLVMNN